MNAPDPARQAEEARPWADKAERDIAAARVLLDAPTALLEAAAFHVQQAAEKLMKAVLVANAVPFRKTHNLNELALQVAGVRPELAAALEPLRALTGWATELRYSGPIGLDAEPLPGRDRVEAALADVLRLRGAVTAIVASA